MNIDEIYNDMENMSLINSKQFNSFCETISDESMDYEPLVEDELLIRNKVLLGTDWALVNDPFVKDELLIRNKVSNDSNELIITDMKDTIANLKMEINKHKNTISHKNIRIHKLLLNIENNDFDLYPFSVGIFVGVLVFYIPSQLLNYLK